MHKINYFTKLKAVSQIIKEDLPPNLSSHVVITPAEDYLVCEISIGDIVRIKKVFKVADFQSPFHMAEKVVEFIYKHTSFKAALKYFNRRYVRKLCLPRGRRTYEL